MLVVVAWVAYFVVLNGHFNGTFGMKWGRLEFTDLRGNSAGWGRSLLHLMLVKISLIWGLGYLMSFFHPRLQTFHDWITRSRILKVEQYQNEANVVAIRNLLFASVALGGLVLLFTVMPALFCKLPI